MPSLAFEMTSELARAIALAPSIPQERRRSRTRVRTIDFLLARTWRHCPFPTPSHAGQLFPSFLLAQLLLLFIMMNSDFFYANDYEIGIHLMSETEEHLLGLVLFYVWIIIYYFTNK